MEDLASGKCDKKMLPPSPQGWSVLAVNLAVRLRSGLVHCCYMVDT
eukprot:SAG31_NODE_31774_length_364_cov_0.939623_2_plen_45_part_01